MNKLGASDLVNKQQRAYQAAFQARFSFVVDCENESGVGEGKIDAVQLLRGRFLENFCFSRISFRKVKYLKIIQVLVQNKRSSGFQQEVPQYAFDIQDRLLAVYTEEEKMRLLLDIRVYQIIFFLSKKKRRNRNLITFTSRCKKANLHLSAIPNIRS